MLVGSDTLEFDMWNSICTPGDKATLFAKSLSICTYWSNIYGTRVYIYLVYNIYEYQYIFLRPGVGGFLSLLEGCITYLRGV